MPKIKRIYVGTNLVYPTWKPNSNTIAYFPLKEDVLDHSWNWNNASWNPNSFTGGVANYSWNSTTLPTSLVSSWTITVNVWFNDLRTSNFSKNISFIGQHTTQNYWFCMRANSYYGSDYNIWTYQSSWSGYATAYYVITEASSTPRTWWHNMVSMRDGSKIYMYLDGQSIWEAAYSWLSSNTFYMGYDHGYDWWAWTGRLSELIFENKIRTAQEIKDYYHQTKAKYLWIS